MTDAAFIDLMPPLRKEAEDNPNFRVRDDGSITVAKTVDIDGEFECHLDVFTPFDSR